MDDPDLAEFAPGGYGDLGGVAIYGPPEKGFWLTKLELSVRYSDRVFGAIHGLSQNGSLPMPVVVQAWADMSGWWDAEQPTALTRQEVREMTESLSTLTPKDMDNDGPARDALLRCVGAMLVFLQDRLDRGEQVYIENL